MTKYNEIGIIIPSLNPNHSFLTLVHELIANNFTQIICIDDGSTNSSLFDEASRLGCYICTHAVNLGKGRALKTAFNYCLTNLPDIKGLITVDGDGQHTLTSIISCADSLLEHLNDRVMILGSRTFSDTDMVKIPFRSKFGNKLTRNVLSFLCGIKVSDTQTGLRGIPTAILSPFLEVKGERYEYEMNMLLSCKDNEISLVEVPIETVYEDNNSVSHFNPLKDSLKIYKTIFMYSMTSIISVLIDYFVFVALFGLTSGIWISTYGARACSSIVNFILNRNIVFRSKHHLITQAVQYFILVFICCTVSAFLVSIIAQYIHIPVIIIKCVIDTLLYFVNFYMQRAFIFCRKK